MDLHYRRFYYHLDKVRNNSIFEELETLVENIYTNGYLDIISKEFSKRLNYNVLAEKYKLQKDFYNNFVANRAGRVIVIISDAFRYEAVKELVEKLNLNEKMDASIEPQTGILPSYTELGMAALLPNKDIEISDDYRVYVDDKPIRDLKERIAIL